MRSRRGMGGVIGVQGLGGHVAPEGIALFVIDLRPQTAHEKSGELGIDRDRVVLGDFVLDAAFDQAAEIADVVVGDFHGAAAQADERPIQPLVIGQPRISPQRQQQRMGGKRDVLLEKRKIFLGRRN